MSLEEFEQKCEAQDWYWPWSDATNADDGSQRQLLAEARQLGPEYVAVYESYRINTRNSYYKA